MPKALLIACSLLVAGCTDVREANRVLLDAGYSDVRVGGYSMLGCSEDDMFATRFAANGPTGRPVSGQVCSGAWGKGSTIRLD